MPATISTTIVGHNGAKEWAVELTENNRKIKFAAVIHEGNAFGPNDNNTLFTLAWIYL